MTGPRTRLASALAAAIVAAAAGAVSSQAQPLPAWTEEDWAVATCATVKAHAFAFVTGTYMDTCLFKEGSGVVDPVLLEFPALGAVFDRLETTRDVSVARADLVKDGISYDVALRTVKLREFAKRSGSGSTPCLTLETTTPARPPALCSSKYKIATRFVAPRGLLFRDTRIKVVVDAAAGSYKLGEKDGRLAAVPTDTTTDEDRDFGLHTARYKVLAPPPAERTTQPAGWYAKARGKFNIFSYAVVIVDAEGSPYKDGPPLDKKWDCEVSSAGELARLGEITEFVCGGAR